MELFYASRKFSVGFRSTETCLIFNPGDFQALGPSVMEFWDAPTDTGLLSSLSPHLQRHMPLEPSLRTAGTRPWALPPLGAGLGQFWLLACLTRGHLILSGFVVFILVNRVVYFWFLVLGVLAHFASLLFTLCKHLGLSKYVYKVPGTGLVCVWYFNGL